MRSFVRLFLALAMVLTLCASLPPAQQAQTKRGPGKLAPTLAPAAGDSYQVTQSTGTIVPGMTKLTLTTGNTDDGTAAITLPTDFTYTFFNASFSTANVGTNGSLQFNSNSTDYFGFAEGCFPLSRLAYAILPHWADLTVGGTNEGIFTSVSGTAPNRIFNIEWRASFFGSTPNSLNFEVRLYEGQSRFDIIYGALSGGGREASVGVQREAGGTFIEYECGGSTPLRSGLMLTFDAANAPAPLFIAGRVTDPDGNPLSDVSVALTGSATATVMTAADGNYQFTGLTAGNNYTVTPSQSGFNFFPTSRSFGPASNRAFNGNFIINLIRTVVPNPGDVLISEFRFRGPTSGIIGNGSLDEYVELYNNTNATLVVNTTDGSSGWLLQASRAVPTPTPSPSPSPTPTPLPRAFVVPNGTAIPARGHYLIGNGSGYVLTSYANTDAGAFFPLGMDIPDDSGIALFNTANTGNVNASTRLDAVGFTGETNPLYCEDGGGATACQDAGLASPGAVDGQYSWVRKLVSGTPQDTDNNAADFVFVSIDGGTYGGVQSTLGAPGPENSSSPIQRNAFIKVALIDTGCTGTTSGANNNPTGGTCPRVRDATPGSGATAFGTLSLRRAFKNSTGAQVTRLRFRIVDITTLPAVGTADLRALTSTDVSATCVSVGTGCPSGAGSTVTIRGTTLEQPPNQPSGGGVNSSLAAGVITLSTPLVNGGVINVQFLLGVAKGGPFRFFVNVESLP